jgi:NAD-dependent deacetylase
VATDTTEQRVREWIADAQPQRVTVLVGAGISTDSGIPDFRGPQGVWTTNPRAQQLFTLQNYLADPELRRLAWRNRLEHPAWGAEPNDGHRALVTLERSGLLRAIITQNIDGLHQRAGNSSETVIEIHGTLFEVECLGCGQRSPMRENLDRVEAGEADPPCRDCGGIQKAATISFGQSLRREVLRAATTAARSCDLFLAVGTTLQVHPVAGLVELGVRTGARLVIVNRDPTPYDELASAVVREPIGTILPRLVTSAAA